MAPTDHATGLTQARLKALLAYDPETGVFTWRVHRGGNAKAGSVAGTISDQGYRVIKINGRTFTAGRLAWLYVTGEWPTHIVDHEDPNKANNAWANIRPANYAENARNRAVHKNKQIGLKGVLLKKDTYRSRPYGAVIRIDGVLKTLGYFTNPEEAHDAYTKASVAAFGAFARS